MAEYADRFEVFGPTVMQSTNSAKKLRGYGDQQDEAVDLVIQGINSKMPERAPADALQYIDQERMLTRAYGESDSAFATRLKNAWDRWHYAGSARGVLKALKDQGYDPTTMILFQQNGLYWTIDTITDNVTRGTIPGPLSFWLSSNPDLTFWSTFVILFTVPPSLWNTSVTVVFAGETTKTATWPTAFADADYDILTGVVTTDGSSPIITISDKTATGVTVNGGPFAGEVYLIAWHPPRHPLVDPRDSELNKLCCLVRRWKAGRSVFDGFVVRLTGNLWGYPVQSWGAPGLTWGGEGFIFRCEKVINDVWGQAAFNWGSPNLEWGETEVVEPVC